LSATCRNIRNFKTYQGAGKPECFWLKHWEVWWYCSSLHAGGKFPAKFRVAEVKRSGRRWSRRCRYRASKPHPTPAKSVWESNRAEIRRNGTCAMWLARRATLGDRKLIQIFAVGTAGR
jgi:hypothetical protein